MKILIANGDFINDPRNIPWHQYVRNIRRDNSGFGGSIVIHDPIGEEGECTLVGNDKVFGFGRTQFGNGIIFFCQGTNKVYTTPEGYPQIQCKVEFEVDSTYMPILSQETLVAYMPQVPWDDFGDHIRLEGDDAEQFMSLWNTYFRQNKDLYNAVYHAEYPLSTNHSSISYIYMNNNR